MWITVLNLAVMIGASPMELVLMGVAGCSAIDMISILKKQRQEISSFKAEVEGERVQVGEGSRLKIFMLFLSRR
jgi:putative redox protein